MNVFAAISDPTRRAMLDLVLKRPMAVREIAEEFPSITQPGISKHLGILRKANLVKVKVVAQKRIYSLNRSGFREINDWVTKYQKFWEANLDALGDYLDREEANETGD